MLYSLFLQEALLLLPVGLNSMLRQKLHEFQRLFDFHQNLIDFTAFNLCGGKRQRHANHESGPSHVTSNVCFIREDALQGHVGIYLIRRVKMNCLLKLISGKEHVFYCLMISESGRRFGVN